MAQTIILESNQKPGPEQRLLFFNDPDTLASSDSVFTTYTLIIYSDAIPSVTRGNVRSLHTPTFKEILSISGGVLSSAPEIYTSLGISSLSEVPQFVLKCKCILRIKFPEGKQRSEEYSLRLGTHRSLSPSDATFHLGKPGQITSLSKMEPLKLIHEVHQRMTYGGAFPHEYSMK